jgi:hypothetical protein
MPTIDGVITMVQEDRFRLVGADGRCQLFLLSHRTRVDGDDLHRFERARTPVTVTHGEAPGLIARTAHTVRPAGPAADGA